MTKILIADDDANFREMLRRLVEVWRSDVRILEAADGAQATETIERERPDIVLTDWDMPSMSGLDICAWAQGRNAAERPCIIAITGHEQTVAAKLFQFAGAAAFFKKGDLPERLVPSLEGLVPAAA